MHKTIYERVHVRYSKSLLKLLFAVHIYSLHAIQSRRKTVACAAPYISVAKQEIVVTFVCSTAHWALSKYCIIQNHHTSEKHCPIECFVKGV
jgi:hypothetical protein